LPDFQTPPNEPGNEKRLLLVFALTFLVIIVTQPLLKKYFPQPVTPPAQSQSQAQQPAPNVPLPAAQTQSSTPPTVASKQAKAETETVVENDLYRITFSNRGGQVKSWVLKKFDDDFGKPLDLVNGPAAAKYGYPLSLWTSDEGLRNKLSSALYVPSTVGNGTSLSELSFDYSDADISLHKTFHFDKTYLVKIESSVQSKGSYLLALPVWPAGFGDQLSSPVYAASRVEYHNEESTDHSYFIFPKLTERLAVKNVSGGGNVHGPLNWAGVVDQYFAAVFIPEDAQNAVLVTLRNPLDIPKDAQKPNPQDTTKVDVLGAAVGNMHGPTVERIFAGPKELQVVESVPVASNSGQADLRDLVNFGSFGIIARPLFLWLRWTYAHIVHNWGWAIVVQTLIITVALLPLRISSMKSALKMQRIQPQMNAIKEKYKKYTMRDPRKQEMNQEIAALMKKEGVSPAGGCVPLIFQMPFLFAYYSMLGASLDLRHAHWLWISDLSSRDPLFILPIAMVLSMVITQRFTPQTGMDPQQQKMMSLMMPLMMGFIFFNLAAGLNLYYAESNLVGIAQQVVMNRSSIGREMRELAEKRARKKDKK
jgi:YidC/Oxa1 family membrane protein insertase